MPINPWTKRVRLASYQYAFGATLIHSLEKVTKDVARTVRGAGSSPARSYILFTFVALVVY